MTSATAQLDLLSPGDIARRFALEKWQVRLVIDRLGIARRVGGYRIIDARDLPLVLRELRRSVYLHEAEGVAGVR